MSIINILLELLALSMEIVIARRHRTVVNTMEIILCNPVISIEIILQIRDSLKTTNIGITIREQSPKIEPRVLVEFHKTLSIKAEKIKVEASIAEVVKELIIIIIARKSKIHEVITRMSLIT